MSIKQMQLLKNNDNRTFSDLEWIQELYLFLQGNVPDGITLGRGGRPRLTQKQAFSVIWYLQEHFPLLPDEIERCDACGQLYDSYAEGNYSEKRQKHFCHMCDDGKD